MATHCTCPASRQPPCAWCTQRMAHTEARADAVITALKVAYPDEADGIDFDAIMQAHHRQDAQEHGSEEPPHPDQLQLFAEERP